MNDIKKAIDILKEKLQISTTGLTVGELVLKLQYF